jgi:hypothetical protein
MGVIGTNLANELGHHLVVNTTSFGETSQVFAASQVLIVSGN